MYGIKDDWELQPQERCFILEDYEGNVARWCPGCGDHAVLSALQRLARDEQIPPEKMVVVSGIGCSSRLPHYMKTYGFHGLHGRALPVACGVRARRPDLNIFVVTGDGDCCAIGTAHWIHAVRYNMNMTVMLLDNNIYGLTKMQSSPTSPKEHRSNTHPFGDPLSPINPLSVTLSITNASFVAQTVDWAPAHVYATLKEAHRHPGLSFVRIMQRCPHYMEKLFTPLRDDPEQILVLEHPDGIPLDDSVKRAFPRRQEHDPADLKGAWELARSNGRPVPMGLLYRNPDAERYDLTSQEGLGTSAAKKVRAVQDNLDRFLV